MKLIYSPRYLDHVQDLRHPESPNRLKTIIDLLENTSLMENVISPNRDVEYALKIAMGVHSPEYLQKLKEMGEGRIDPDTVTREGTYNIALLAVQGGTLAADYAYNGEPAFALLRPPGHHSGASYGGGFCYMNNIAAAAQHILDTTDASKVAIVDIDVHHGNGTWDIFRERSDVLYVSTHQWGIYPGTGSADTIGDKDGEGYTVSIPFPSGAGDSSYKLAWHRVISPVVRDFGPDIILVSMGVDAHYMDPLASLTLSTPGYLDMARKLNELAVDVCGGKIAYFLEGGYHLNALAEVVVGIVSHGAIDPKFTDVADNEQFGGDAVDSARLALSGYWNI